MKSEPSLSQEGMLSEQEREFVAKIERLPISDESRIDLLLVWQGLKPATGIHLVLRKWYRDERKDLSPDEERFLIEEAKNLFSSMGLKLVEGRKKHDEIYSAEEGEGEFLIGNTESQTIFVAATEENVKKLADAYYKDERENCAAIGRLFGFPETAVKAYEKVVNLCWNENGKRLPILWDEASKGILTGIEDLPAEIKKQDFVAFAEFALSVDHWQEELDKARIWAEEVEKANPVLYARKVEEYHSRMIL